MTLEACWWGPHGSGDWYGALLFLCDDTLVGVLICGPEPFREPSLPLLTGFWIDADKHALLHNSTSNAPFLSFLIWLIMRTPLLPLTLLLLVSTVATLEINHSKNLELNTTSRSNLTISAAWYTGWHAIDFPLSKVSWSKYTHLIYAFGWAVRP